MSQVEKAIPNAEPVGTDNVQSYCLKVFARDIGGDFDKALEFALSAPELIDDPKLEDIVRIAFFRILMGTEEGVKAWQYPVCIDFWLINHVI